MPLSRSCLPPSLGPLTLKCVGILRLDEGSCFICPKTGRVRTSDSSLHVYFWGVCLTKEGKRRKCTVGGEGGRERERDREHMGRNGRRAEVEMRLPVNGWRGLGKEGKSVLWLISHDIYMHLFEQVERSKRKPAKVVLKIYLPGTCFIACFTLAFVITPRHTWGAEALGDYIPLCELRSWGFNPELSILQAAALSCTKIGSSGLSWGAWTKVCLHVKAPVWLGPSGMIKAAFPVEPTSWCLAVHAPSLGSWLMWKLPGTFINGRPFLCWQAIDRHSPKCRSS